MRPHLVIPALLALLIIARPSNAVYPDKPSVTVHLSSMAEDSCVFSGRDSTGQAMTIVMHRTKVDVDLKKEMFSFTSQVRWYHWQATCDNVAFDTKQVQDLGEILFGADMENTKMATVAKYLTEHKLWPLSGERQYVL